MRSSFTFSTALVAMSGSFVTSGQDQEQRQHASLSTASLHKRASSVCEQTYGVGSVECGNSQATMCYNPSIGQSCCVDNGYCDSGQYCAPVAGYCCLESEDLRTCATNAGFELPQSVLAALASATSSANVSTATAAAATGPPSSAAGRPPNNINNSSTGGTPHVQVSAVARKEQWTLVWMSLGIGIVGVIMATF